MKQDDMRKLERRIKLNAEAQATAFDVCMEINPDNPMAVAQAIKPMYEAVKLWKEHQQGTRGHYCPKCDEALQKALAQAERKVE